MYDLTKRVSALEELLKQKDLVDDNTFPDYEKLVTEDWIPNNQSMAGSGIQRILARRWKVSSKFVGFQHARTPWKPGGKRKHRANTQCYLLHLMLLHGLHYYWHGTWLVQRSGISISHSA